MGDSEIAARASRLEADAKTMKTQNELKLEIDDTNQRIEKAQDRLADHEYQAAQHRVDAKELREQAAKWKREVSGEEEPGGKPVTGEEIRPYGEQARQLWRQAQDNERRAASHERQAQENEEAAAATRTELEQYERHLDELQETYEDNKLMTPDDYDPAAPPQGDFEPGTGSEVAALVGSEADALGDGADGDVDALTAQVEMAAAGTDAPVAGGGLVDAENPEHPGFGPEPEDPTTDMETPESPDILPTPEDPTIDVETPEVPDIPMPEPAPEPDIPDTGDAGGMDFETA